jgi:hypothetical protein
MSRQANARRMQELVARWRSRGGSAVAFATKHGVSEAKFGYWRRRLDGRHRSPTAEGIEFQPIRLVEPASAGLAALEIAFAGGERVLVHDGASVETLARVVTALRARC